MAPGDGEKHRKSSRPQLPEKYRDMASGSSASDASNPLPDPVHGGGVRSSNNSDFMNGTLIPDTSYRLGRIIGSGTFGQVRLTRDVKTGDILAVKLEPDEVTPLQLANEWEFYTKLNKTPAAGVPKVFHFGRCGQNNAMVIELLGPSLEQIFKMCERKFSLHTLLMIAVQLVTRVEYIHSCCVVNRDIKPENMLIAKQPKRDSSIFIVDFGLSGYVIDPDTGTHIPLGYNRSFIGTPRYMSIHTHTGVEQSRRDDLESLGYSLIYFLRGSLPWQGLHSLKGGNPYQHILDMKKGIDLGELCQREQEFVQYMQYVRKLQFSQQPDYDYLRELFSKRMKKDGYDPEGKMDWTDKMADKTWTRRLQRIYQA